MEGLVDMMGNFHIFHIRQIGKIKILFGLNHPFIR